MVAASILDGKTTVNVWGSVNSTSSPSNFTIQGSSADVANYARQGNDLVITMTGGEVHTIQGFGLNGWNFNNLVFVTGETSKVVNLQAALSMSGDGIIDALVTTQTIGASTSTSALLGILGGVAAVGGLAAVAGGGAGEEPSTPIDTTPPDTPREFSIANDTGISASDGITSNNRPEFTGKAEPNARIEVYVNGDSIGTTTVDNDGHWTLRADTPLTDGSYIVTVQATDDAGNVSATSPGLPLVIDTSCAAPSLDSSSNTTTNDNTLIFSGVGDPNVSVEVFLDGGSIGIAMVGADGIWTLDYTGTPLPDGSYTVTVQATDPAGNVSPLSVGHALLVDTTCAAPSIDSISGDTGAASTDAITSDTTLIFSGHAEANASVELFIDNVSIGTTTADGSGVWSFDHTGTVLAEGTYTVTAQATDPAGNISPTSTGYTFTVDTTCAAPSIDSISGDTGTLATDGITSDTTLIFAGNAEANASVELFIGGISIGTTTADGTGVWSFDHTGTVLAEGTYTVTAQATDPAGNVSPDSTGYTFTVDTTCAAPTIDSISGDTGTLATDGITSDTTLIFAGNAEANASVELFIDNVSIGTTTADGAGVWSFDHTGTVLAEGTYTVTAQATDIAGNVSLDSADYTFTVDTTCAAPIIDSISGDTGAASTDAITSDTTLIFSGHAEANASVELFIDNVSIGTTTADGSGVWSFDHTGTVLAEDTYTVTAQATDPAGNVSPDSAGYTFTVDTTCAAPTIDSISGDTGTSSTDGITSDNTLMFSGQAEANASVELFIASVSIGTTTADAIGNWSFDYTATVLADGTYAVTAQATDPAGNISLTSTAYAFRIDRSCAAPTIDSISGDTGTLATDGITSDTTLIFAGNAEANATVELFIDNVSIGTTTADGAGVWSFDHTDTVLADGSYTVTAQATDIAGNVSLDSADYALTVDTTCAAPSIDSISGDTGAASTDAITSDTTLIFSGNAEANASVELFIDNVSIGTTTADGAGVWSFDHTGTVLADGSYTVTAQATDIAGNVSPDSADYALTVDTTCAAPTIDSISGDTGTLATDGITSDTTLIFAGNAEANASVELFIDNVSIGTTTADGAGVWSFDHTGTVLAEGTYTVTAQATDPAGNVSPDSAGYTFTVDTTCAAPTIDSISGDTGTLATDAITSDTTLIFAGNAEANATVELFIDNVSIGTTTADGAGVWSFDHTGTVLADGTYTVTAQATDIAGNVSPDSADYTFTVDTTCAAPIIDSISGDTGAASTDAITSDTTLIFSGHAEANASVELFIDNVSIGTTTADGSGVWSFDHTGTVLAEDTYTVTAQATDPAGNVSPDSAGYTFTVDTTCAAPTIDSISGDTGTSSTDGITSDNTLMFSGQAEANASVELFIASVSIGTTTADAIGNWSFDYTATVLADGTYAVTAQATDPAGNISLTSTAYAFRIDRSCAAPTIDSISGDTGTLATDGITSDTTLIFAGNAEANATVELFIDNVSIGTTTADGAGVWSFDHTDTVLADGTYTVTAQATDTAGNVSLESAGYTLVIEAAPIEVTITGNGSGTGVITFTFSQAIDAASFMESDITVSNGTLNTGTLTKVNGTTWTATVTPAFGSANTNVAVTIAAGAVYKASGALNTEGRNVTTLDNLFNSSSTLNGDITGWDTSHAISAYRTFYNNLSFNQDISGWDVSNVTNMAYMFCLARAFNQDIGDWNVSSATDMYAMFWTADDFNQDIGDWDVGSVIDMSSMFRAASAFNQDIGDWNVSSAIDMNSMFWTAYDFNQDIGDWDVGSVIDMSSMFRAASAFNQDIGDWNVSSAIDMNSMFWGADDFDQDIGDWDVGSATDMSSMLRGASAFNQDIGGWDVSSVKTMSSMFRDAIAFNQDLGSWDISSLTSAQYMFLNSGISVANMDATLRGWAKLDTANGETAIQNNVIWDIGEYTDATAREYLVGSYGWTIIGTLNSGVSVGTQFSNLINRGAFSTDQVIHGLGGDDILYGGSGNDWIVGGAGNDSLTGNGGRDTFHYGFTNAGSDTITFLDTGPSGDMIHIADLLIGYQVGISNVSDFITAENNGSGGTLLKIDHDGTGIDTTLVTINLQSVDYGPTALNDLLNEGNIILT